MMGLHAKTPSWRALLATIVLSPLWLVTSAFAEEAASEEKHDVDWMPSFSISVGVHTQSMSGDTSSTNTDFPREDGDSFITEFFQFQGKLHTPIRFGSPTWGRLFLVAGAQIPLAEGLIGERIDSSFDDVDPGFTQNCPSTIPTGSPPPATSSCSLRIRNRVSFDAMWHAGLGFDFTLPLESNQFHIQPALEYYGLAAQTVGEFRRTSSSGGFDDFIETANATGDPEIFHGISPSITFLVDVYEDGPWRWSMFLQGRTVHLLKEPDLRASKAVGSNTIQFDSGIDDFIMQASGGIQIQWTGQNRRR